MSTEIRWKQRFMNYEKSFIVLKEGVDRGVYDKLSQAGLIQIFEVTFELAWKTLKDRLEYEGFEVNSPRETFKTAFQNGYIRDGEIWIDVLDKRNLLAHIYDEARSNEARDLIRGPYFLLLKELYELLKKDSAR